jgi:hypothetical protein
MDRRLGRAAAFAAVIAAAFVASKSCGSTEHAVSQDEAIEIAREKATFEPDRVQIRFVQRGIPVRGFWAVSLYTQDAEGIPDRVKVVLVDAETGEISQP